jgi:peptide deformylase
MYILLNEEKLIMKKLKIIRLGHPSLRKRSSIVKMSEIKTELFQNFLDELSDLCIKFEGVGIAAPQVDVNKRIIIVHVDPKNSRYKDKNEYPLTVVINPKIIQKSKTLQNDWEGDLSCDLRALVPRAINCKVIGVDRNCNHVEFTLNDPFHARVFQHEIDHLNGVLLLDRVKKKNTISEIPEWKKYWKDKNIED